MTEQQEQMIFNEGYRRGKADRPKGEWIKSKTHASMWVCSNCDWGYQDCYDFNFCPNCGADMRGEDNEID